MNPIIYKQLITGVRLLRRVYSTYQQLVQTIFDRWRLINMSDFNNLLLKISNGTEICSDDVLPHINQGNLKVRLWVNFKLAEAFYNVENYVQAKVFIQRTWMFSRFDETYLSLFLKIHATCDDVDSIREAHKALGMKKSNAKKTSQALKHFNAWQNAYSVHRLEDKYYYDFEILDRITQLAKPYAFPLRLPQLIKNKKIRLAYLMFGMMHINSVIVKINLLFAKYHDPSRFEVTFYVPERASSILNYPDAVENIKIIEQLGWKVVLAPDSVDSTASLSGLAKLIYETQPDILITSAGLADFKHYFITALQPAPLVIGLCSGPPPQFIAPNFDWSITWFRSTMIESPTDCSLVDLRLDLPDREYSREVSKSRFGIPMENLVVMTCGRPAKLQDVGFLKALVDLVSSNPNVYLVVVGGGEEMPSVIRDPLMPDVIERIKILGWEKDFLGVLSMADVVVDTYPSGGGVVIKSAMALGTPVVSFKHNHMKTFSQKEWSVAEETIGMPELLIERGDFTALNKLLSRLLTGHKYRENLSVLCKERINETSGSAEQMVKKCEHIYLDVIHEHQ